MKVRRSKRFCYLAAGLILTGWLQQGVLAQAPALPSVTPSYILQPGDEVAISVAVPGYDAAGAIAPDGMLYLKKLGEVRAAGLTIAQLDEQIEKILAKTLRKPQAYVSLTKLAPPLPPNKITVVGSVTTPGPRDLEPGLRAAKAIELAGGALKDADRSKVVIIHRDLSRKEVDLGTPEKVSDPNQNVLLQEGDSVYVSAIPPKEIINLTVGGAVLKTGPLVLDEAPRVLKAIELAGGAAANADLSKVTVTRKSLKMEIVDLSNPAHVADPAHNVLLADGDSVNIPARILTVSIEGAVVNPGNYEIKPGWGLDDLLLAAGKLTIMANTEKVELRRAGEAPVFMNLAERFQPGQPKVVLEPGDRVIIQEYKDRVLINGVGPAGGYRPIVPGQTIADFFKVAENSAILDTTKIDISKTEVERSGLPAMRVNLKKIRRDPRDKQNIKLAAGDVIWLEGKQQSNNSTVTTGIGILSVLSRFFVP